MNRTVVIDVVGLTGRMLGEHTPHLSALAKAGASRPLRTILPALTCPVQSTFTTGLAPAGHGVVGNGWYFRDLAEVGFWKQSNHLVAGEKIWEAARKRDTSFTCAKLFWWFNMYSAADVSVTPRPIYWADGAKYPDIYTQPIELRDELVESLGEFPLFHFWGPKADIKSSRWILDAARRIYDRRKPTLTLVYVPHLDYDLQRFGPEHPRIAREIRAVDDIVGEFVGHVRKDGTRVIVLSEYAITGVSGVVHVNRVLRREGLLSVRRERGLEKLDAGASEAFAVADHQIAHVYVRRPERIGEVHKLVGGLSGVERVLRSPEKRAAGIEHPRAGELVAVAAKDHWFSYYYWLDEERAPEFARTVDIHRKPGYDPAELFVDPAITLPALRVGWALARKALGGRYLLRTTPLDASLVKGSHGRPTDDVEDGPVFISSEGGLVPEGPVDAPAVKDLVLAHLG